jgi:hypothetical protein
MDIAKTPKKPMAGWISRGNKNTDPAKAPTIARSPLAKLMILLALKIAVKAKPTNPKVHPAAIPLTNVMEKSSISFLPRYLQSRS